jgi:hypothetical protein
VRVVPLVAVLAVVLAFAGAAQAGSRAPGELSASQVVARFKAATGSRLLVDKRSSYAGHYTALALAGSISNQGRYGRFTIYVVGPTSRAEDVSQLLADAHTGVLGAPGSSSIYWESGRYLSGERYWLAKKLYGANVVLWWYGTERKIDKAFKRLHLPLRRAVAS